MPVCTSLSVVLVVFCITTHTQSVFGALLPEMCHVAQLNIVTLDVREKFNLPV